MATAPSLPAMPKALGRYEIQSELGRGAMGVVYKAEDPVLGRTVALKVIHVAFPVGEEEQRVLEERFLREASLAASLSHPNIVVVHDVGWDPHARTSFIALEYLEGWTLADVMAPGECMDWRVAARMTARVAEALHHAHSHGVVHRDVKPSNIMLLPSGQAKILDFGVAKASNAHVTTPGELWGTPFYMSPEQASGGMVDGRSDLFSLGSVLYELITGRRAFAREGVAQVIHGLLHEDPPRPSRINATLPLELDVVVARALAKDRTSATRTGGRSGRTSKTSSNRDPCAIGGSRTPPPPGSASKASVVRLAILRLRRSRRECLHRSAGSASRAGWRGP